MACLASLSLFSWFQQWTKNRDLRHLYTCSQPEHLSTSPGVQRQFGIVSWSHYCAELHTRLFLPTNLFHNAKILESSKREPCGDCGKMFRTSILQSHQRNHTKRSNFQRKVQPSTLVPAQKSFGSWLNIG